MKRLALLFVPVLLLAGSSPIQVGRRLPDVTIQDEGALVPACTEVNGHMALVSKQLGHRPWSSREMDGRVRTLYHLAARMGIDDVNKPFIDALIAAKLPEYTPDGAYKTITILDLSDALWGTVGLGRSRLESSQRDFPWAIHVMDDRGVARAAWQLPPKQSSVIILDRDGTVLFFKVGKLSPEEIGRAIGIIKEHLAKPLPHG
ncbi:MAG TPA: YtfJ family protein [Holophagaceae bacterium]